jgi:hypothetical protein
MQRYSRKKQKKIQLLLEYWYYTRYLKALYDNPPPIHIDATDKNTGVDDTVLEIQNKWYQFDNITASYLSDIKEFKGLGMAPIVLYNIPREYERWRDNYGVLNANITRMNLPDDSLWKPARKYYLPYVPTVDEMKELKDNSDSENEDDPDYDTSHEEEDEEDEEETIITRTEHVSIGFKDDQRVQEEIWSIDKLVIDCTNEGEQEEDEPDQIQQNTDNQQNTTDENQTNDALIIPPGYTREYTPFDVSLHMHPSILLAARYSVYSNTHCKSIRNHESWDPLLITNAIVGGCCDFSIADFYELQDHNQGIKKKTKKRKSTDTNKSEEEAKPKSTKIEETKEGANNETQENIPKNDAKRKPDESDVIVLESTDFKDDGVLAAAFQELSAIPRKRIAGNLKQPPPETEANNPSNQAQPQPQETTKNNNNIGGQNDQEGTWQMSWPEKYTNALLMGW